MAHAASSPWTPSLSWVTEVDRRLERSSTVRGRYLVESKMGWPAVIERHRGGQRFISCWSLRLLNWQHRSMRHEFRWAQNTHWAIGHMKERHAKHLPCVFGAK